jgi:hypothetical protein
VRAGDDDYRRYRDHEDITGIRRSAMYDDRNSGHQLNNACDQRNQAAPIQAVLGFSGGHRGIVAQPARRTIMADTGGFGAGRPPS